MDYQDTLHVWNVTEQLLSSRVIKVYDEINMETAKEVCALLDVLSNDDPTEPIKLEICSPGGDVLAGLAICDKIKQIPNPVIAFNNGYSASMGTVISSCCDYVYGSKNAYFMIHEISSGTQGKFRDVKSAAEFDEKLNIKTMGIIAARCHKTYDQVMADVVRDKWMNADEALKYGLIDAITPEAKKDMESLASFNKSLTSQKKGK
jgi:ATP-dependent Clp protease protease subunit